RGPTGGGSQLVHLGRRHDRIYRTLDIVSKSQLARPRPRSVDLRDLRGRLALLRDVIGEGLAVRLPRGSDAAVGRARGLFDIEEGGGVEPRGHRPHVGKLATGAPVAAVQPDVRRPRRIADGERKVVVAGVRAGTDPRRLRDRLRDAGRRIPDLDRARAGHSIVETAPAAAPRGHSSLREAEGEAAVDGPPDLE